MRILMLSCLPLVIGVVVSAQDVVVPGNRAGSDGSSGGAFPGAEQRFQMQVMLDGGALQSAANRSLTSVSFRRDGQHPGSQQGGRASLRVRLSTPSFPASNAGPTFTANHGTNVQDVFSGEIAMPASPALGSRNGATWATPDAIVIGFAAPFAYAGGTLCVDVAGTPVVGATTPWWRIDAEVHTHDASVQALGVACDPFADAVASRNTLLPGGSLDLLCAGPRNSTGVLMIAASALPQPVDLAFLGAPGCFAGLAPAATLSTLVSGGPASVFADANITIQLPAASWIAGGRLHAQWAVFPNPRNAALLSTSRVLDLGIASAPSPLPGVLVRSGPLDAVQPWPALGRVYPQLLPVLRLTFQ